MIQRIQSLSLLLAMGAIIALIFLPIAQFMDFSNNVYTLGFYGVVKDPSTAVPSVWMTSVYPVLCMIVVLLILVTIFLYKNRPLQIKMCFYALLAIVIFAVFNYWMITTVRKNEMWRMGASTIYSFLPYAAGVFVYLSRRAIQKDEELVKSADRIR